MLLFLLSADLVNTMLSAFLAFCDRLVYTYYLTQPNPFYMSPLSDQILGAVIMWIIGSFVFLAPATLITFRLLQIPSDVSHKSQEDCDCVRAAHLQPINISTTVRDMSSEFPARF